MRISLLLTLTLTSPLIATITQAKEVQRPNQLISQLNFRKRPFNFRKRPSLPTVRSSGIDSLIFQVDFAMARRDYRKAENLFREILRQGPSKRHEFHLGLGVTQLSRFQSPIPSSNRPSVGDAISEFERALELEDDYPPALFMLYKAYETKGNFYRKNKTRNLKPEEKFIKGRTTDIDLDKIIENYQKAKSYFDKFNQLKKTSLFRKDRGESYTRSQLFASLESINSKLSRAYMERGDEEKQNFHPSQDKILEDYEAAFRSLGLSQLRVIYGDCGSKLNPLMTSNPSSVHGISSDDLLQKGKAIKRKRSKFYGKLFKRNEVFKRSQNDWSGDFLQRGKVLKRKRLEFNDHKIQPLESEVKNKLAIAYVEKGDRESSLEDKVNAYCKALRTDIKYTPAYIKLGKALWDSNKQDAGIKYYERAIQVDKKYVEAYLALAKAYSTQKNQRAAGDIYFRLFKVAPDTPNLAARLSHEDLNNFASYLRQNLKNDPKNSHKHYYYLGNVLNWKGDYQEAIENYDRSISFRPNASSGRFFPNTLRTQAFRNKGIALSKLGKHKQAIESIYLAMGSSPKAIDHYFLGEVLVNQGIDLERAIENYNHAIEIENNYALAYNARGKARVMLEDYKGAIRDFKYAIKSDEEYAEPYNHIGQLLQRRKQFDQAISYYAKALTYSDHNYAEASDNKVKAMAQLENFLDIMEYKGPTCKNCDWFWHNPNEKYFKLRRSVVRIYSEVSGIGAGWVIKKEDNRLWIVTNRHVVSEGDEFNVEFYSSKPIGRDYLRITAHLDKVTNDNGPDLALLLVDNPPVDIEPLKITSDSPQLNASVTAIGHPQGIGDDWSLSDGSVSNNSNNELQIDAPLASGNSGGPLINKHNQVVGIIANTAPSANDATATAGFGYAIPINVLNKTLSEWGFVVPSR